MKIVALSDLHGLTLPPVSSCDVFIIAGDLCPDNRFTLKDKMACAEIQSIWLRDVFAPWLRALHATRIILIPGNHDFVFEVSTFALWPGNVTFLLDSSVTIDGVHFYGTPWVSVGEDRMLLGSPVMPRRWAFDIDPKALADKMAAIPDCDVLITHGPPYGLLDEVRGGYHVGSRSLNARLQTHPRKAHVFGHIHEGRGNVGRSWNCAALDAHYNPVDNPAFEFEIQSVTSTGSSSAPMASLIASDATMQPQDAE